MGDTPGERGFTRHAAIVALALMAGSAAALLVAPTLMPESYDWVEHTTSESGGQGVEGAWLARLGFLFFGFGAFVLAYAAAPRWKWPGIWLVVAFGVFMVGTAAFSARSWDSAAPYDDVEDLLHSITSSGVGFSFAFAVLFVLFRRRPEDRSARVFDILAIAASVVLPLSMANWSGAAGVFQRAMFAIAYGWFAVEAVRSLRAGSGTPPSVRDFTTEQHVTPLRFW